MAGRALGEVGLPVGVGYERDRDVEGEVGRHAGSMLRVQRQMLLQPQYAVENQKAAGVEGQHRERESDPVLTAAGVDSSGAIKQALDRTDDRVEEGRLSGPD